MGVKLNLSNGEFLMLKNEIDWDFSKFNPGKVKNSQNIKEFDWWLTWIRKEWDLDYKNPKGTADSDINVMKPKHGGPFYYLEIGSYAGESLFYISQILPKNSVITLVDLGDNVVAREILVEKTIPWVKEKFGHQINLLSGDANDPQIIHQTKAFAPNGRYDMVFIDANHSFEYAIKDFKNYKDKATWIAFHDISKFNTEKTKIKYKVYQANVNHIWEVLKLVIPEVESVTEPLDMPDFPNAGTKSLITNWYEFIDNNNNPVGVPGTLKTRGISVLRSFWK